MTLRAHRFEPGDVTMPVPRVPALPGLGARLRHQLLRRAPDPCLGAGAVRSYARSRYALTDALRLCGVGPGTAVLVPAYHCLTMVDPGVRLGAHTLLYPLTPALAPEPAGLAALCEASPLPVRALLLTHYFGLRQDAAAWARWARQHGIALIEDGSHCLPALRATGLGRAGRFSIWSPYKFHPSADGGELFAADAADLAPLRPTRPAGAKAHLRAVLHRWQARRAVRPGLDPAALADELDAVLADPQGDGLQAEIDYLEPSPQYQVADEGLAALVESRWIARHIDAAAVAERRRRRYSQWLDTVRGLPGCAPLLPELGADDVPYMFPLRVREPQRAFMPLRRLGMTVWRWDSMAVSGCPVAAACRLGVFQLPCHQDIDDAQMDWMQAAVTTTLRRVA
jgi:hypothetical protein